MNRVYEFRRLRWLLQVQDLLQKEKQRLMAERLLALNVEETALEFNRNELDRLIVAEQKITELSYTYDFDREPTEKEIVQYVTDMIGLRS
jgi:hypothetical protein